MHRVWSQILMYGRKVRAHRVCKRRLRRIFSRGLEPKSGLRGVVWMRIKPKSGPWGRFFFAVHPTCLSPHLSYIKQYTNYLPSHLYLHLANLYPVSQPTSPLYSKQPTTYWGAPPISFKSTNLFMNYTSRPDQDHHSHTFYPLDHNQKLFRVTWLCFWSYSKALSCYRLDLLITINEPNQ